jgi:hypothetical protein
VVAGVAVAEAAEAATMTSVSPPVVHSHISYINEISGFIWLRYFPQLATVRPAVRSTTLPSTPNKEAAVTLVVAAEAAATMSVSPPAIHPTYQ